MRPLIALTPTEAAQLLEVARARCPDGHKAGELLAHLAALIERAQQYERPTR